MISTYGKKLTGGSVYEKFRHEIREKFNIKKGENFSDYVIFVEKSKDGKLNTKIEKIEKDLITEIEYTFSPLVSKLKKLISLDDKQIAEIDNKNLEKALKRIDKFRKLFNENIKKYVLLEDFYSVFLDKIDNIEKKCIESRDTNILNPLQVSQLSVGKNKVSRENKVRYAKIVLNIIDSFKNIENPILQIFIYLENESLKSLREIDAFARSFLKKENDQNNINIIKQIILVCEWFINIPDIVDSDIKLLSNDLEKIIRYDLYPLILTLKEIITLNDKEIISLSDDSLRNLLDKAEIFKKSYMSNLKKYKIIEVFYKDIFDKVIVLSKKLEDALNNIELRQFKEIDMSSEDKRNCSKVISKILSINIENFELELVNFIGLQRLDFLQKIVIFARFLLSSDDNYDKRINIEKIAATCDFFIKNNVDRDYLKKDLLVKIESIFRPLILKLKETVCLSDNNIKLLDKDVLIRGLKRMNKFKNFYIDNVKKYVIFEDFYKDEFDKIVVVTKKFEDALNKVDLKHFQNIRMSDEEKRICSKIIDKLFSYNSESFELELVRLLGSQKSQLLKRIELFSRSIAEKENKKDKINILQKIRLMCDFFIGVKEEERAFIAKDLVEKIESVFISNYFKLKKIIVLNSSDIGGLEEQALKSAKKKIKDFYKDFDLIVKKYSIFENLYRELKDTVDRLDCEIQLALDKIEVALYDNGVIDKNIKLECFRKVKELINNKNGSANVFDLKSKIEKEEVKSLRAIKFIAQSMLKNKDYDSKKTIITNIVWLAGQEEAKKVNIVDKSNNNFRSESFIF